MHVTTQARTLAMALAFVSSAIVKKKNVPILTCTKIDAGDSHLAVTGCDLDVLLSAEIEAGIDAPSAACVPHARLAGLIAALPADAEVTIERHPEFDDDRVIIKCGRGRWRLPVLDPIDFPIIAVTAPGAATFRLPGAEARRLIKRAAPAISDEKTRIYLNGLHVTHRDSKLVFVGCDGRRLAEAQSRVDPGIFAPVILPTATVALLDEVAATGDVTVRLTDRVVEFTGSGLLVRSKLIDGTFPDYARVVPPPSDNTVTVEAAPVLAAVERLVAVAEGVEASKSIGIAWGNGDFSLCLSRAPDEGHEEIEPISVNGAGRVAVRGSFLQEQIAALGANLIRLDHADSGSALRIDRPDEPMTVSVIMPMRWEAPAQERRAA